MGNITAVKKQNENQRTIFLNIFFRTTEIMNHPTRWPLSLCWNRSGCSVENWARTRPDPVGNQEAILRRCTCNNYPTLETSSYGTRSSASKSAHNAGKLRGLKHSTLASFNFTCEKTKFISIQCQCSGSWEWKGGSWTARRFNWDVWS